jgi:hypothetical protein
VDVLLPFAIVAGIVGIVLGVAVSAHGRTIAARNAAWAEAAEVLGVSARPASFTKRHRLEGMIDGFRLSVEQLHDDDSVITVFRLDFHGAGIEYRLRPESGLSRFGRRLGLGDPEVGDAAFDEAVRIKAPAPERLATFLTSRRRSVATAFLSSTGRPTIRDGEVELRRGGTPKTVLEIVDTVRALEAVAAEFDASPRSEAKPMPPIEEELAVIAAPVERIPVVPEAPPVDPDALIADVLDGGSGVMAALEVFEDRYAGRPIDLSGQVLRSERPGATGRPAMAVVRIGRLRSGAYGGRDVVAHVFLGDVEPPERDAEVTLRGIVDRADPLLRRVYVEDGVIDGPIRNGP